MPLSTYGSRSGLALVLAGATTAVLAVAGPAQSASAAAGSATAPVSAPASARASSVAATPATKSATAPTTPPATKSAATTSSTATALSAAFDNVGISDNSDTAAADLDGSGHSFSAEDLAAAGWTPGVQITLNATALTWPDVPAGQADNVVADGQTIALAGSGSALTFLLAGTAADSDATGTVGYADGSTQTFSLSVADWTTGPTDTMAVQLPHWNGPDGTLANPVRLYADTVALNASATVASVTLPTISAAPGPSTAAMHVFALALRPPAGGWTGTWAASVDDGLVDGPWTSRTLRMVEYSSAGGQVVRIRLDNAFASGPVVIGHATIAVQKSGAVAAAAPVTLTFGGSQSTTIPAGGQAISDSAGLRLPADTDLLVSIYLTGPVQLAAYHSMGIQDMYSTADGAGDQTEDVANFPVGNTFDFWTLLSGIDVMSVAPPGTVVALGDSITDGYMSTSDANDRWPNYLSRRLQAQLQYPHYGVLDEGISSNKILTDSFTGLAGSGNGGISALARLDRDVFAQSGVTTVIVLEGINDLKSGATPAQVIAGLEQIATQAHAWGLRVVVGTITPFEGYPGYTAAYEANRETVNDFIRDNGGVFDGVVDFDAALRNPSNPLALAPAYDSGDHLHPNNAGYQAMANAVDLSQLG
jgi:lysophospholipase L1-like esterase